MLIFLAFLIIFVFIFVVLKIWSKPKSKYSRMKDSATSFTSAFDMDKPPTALDRILRKVARNRTKKYGKYKPGALGLSAVSHAIKKDFGVILSRKQRKHYSKTYGIPFVVYRGN